MTHVSAVSLFFFRVVLVSWLGMLSGASFAAESLPDLDREKVEISLLSSFPETLPGRGSIILDFRVRNHTDRTAVWTLDFKSSRGWNEEKSLFTQRRVEVAAKSAQTVRWEIPLYPGTEFEDREEMQLRVGVRGTGASGQMYQLLDRSGNYRTRAHRALVLVSPALIINEGRWNYSEIKNEINNNNEPLLLSEFDLGGLPQSVSGFSGVDVLLISESEWQALRPSHPMILSWVAAGGQLVIRDGDPQAEGPLGAGKISGLGKSQAPAAVIRTLKGLQTTTGVLSSTSSFRRNQWNLADGVVEIKPSFGLIMLLVITIAGLLGPLNIWLSFRKRNSMQVIWTTPVISVLLSLLVGAGIIISDGFGGKGMRSLYVLLMPDQAVEVTWQEQISRTGVLLRNRFELPEGTELYPVPPERSREKRQLSLSQSPGGVWSGDWFENRSIQAQVLRQIRSSRAAVKLIPGPQPTVLSTVDATFSRILIRDRVGALWYGENISPGKTSPLRKVDRETAAVMFKEMNTRKENLFPGQPAFAQANWFYAESLESERYIDTLSSIKWQDRPVWYMGPLQGEVAP